MKYAQLYNLMPADRIVEPLFITGLSMHHSIYLGSDNMGQEWIAENHNKFGVRLLRAEEYFPNVRRISRVEKFKFPQAERQKAINRAIALQGKPYDLVKYNCEHFANEIQYGNAKSRQVFNWIVGIASALALIAVFNKKNR